MSHDYDMVDKTSTTRRRGEVIAFERAVRGGHAVINDAELAEPYAAVQGPAGTDYDPGTVPAGQLFVFGDNRHHVLDSRVWGWLPEQDVIGRVNLEYFSQEPVTGAVRWERIGLPVR